MVILPQVDAPKEVSVRFSGFAPVPRLAYGFSALARRPAHEPSLEVDCATFPKGTDEVLALGGGVHFVNKKAKLQVVLDTKKKVNVAAFTYDDFPALVENLLYCLQRLDKGGRLFFRIEDTVTDPSVKVLALVTLGFEEVSVQDRVVVCTGYTRGRSLLSGIGTLHDQAGKRGDSKVSAVCLRWDLGAEFVKALRTLNSRPSGS